MDMVDRYVYAVTKRLPEKSRADVEKELRSNIADMLPEPCNDADVNRVLHELGNPAVIADEYMDKKRYLISPSLYSSYIYVLKLGAMIAGSVLIIVSLISVITDPQLILVSEFIASFLSKIIKGSFDAAFQVFAWVTIVFAVIDRVNKQPLHWPFTGKEWSVNDLEPIPKSASIIKRSEPIASIIFTILFTLAICSFSEYIGIYFIKEGELNITAVFDYNVLRLYIPFFLFLAAISIFISVLKLIYQAWNLRLAIINTINNILSAGIICSFVLNGKLINESFYTSFAQYAGSSADIISKILHWGVLCVVIITILTSIWDSVDGFIKAKKRGWWAYNVV